jgi:alkyl sulfatase BDS1-like metallo-beta-lactamase superfamily hydrolase
MISVMFSPGNAKGKTMKNYRKLIVGCFAIMAACSAFPVHAAPGAEPKPATAATQAYLEQFSASLPFADREDFELATRGFVAAIPGNRILDAQANCCTT